MGSGACCTRGDGFSPASAIGRLVGGGPDMLVKGQGNWHAGSVTQSHAFHGAFVPAYVRLQLCKHDTAVSRSPPPPQALAWPVPWQTPTGPVFPVLSQASPLGSG
ncbi:FCH and double SH3 domains protein 1 [Platysternon megacephalum]|uniref:FCH and double SH3 domains protein 1 n=1 Tax=Platysternon megacephalum TaxID=55544 RepID=A0A4D9E1B6_9SAUR|nr:FCH and double SH3 domains protein 1 [Platysternon megacephalum]